MSGPAYPERVRALFAAAPGAGRPAGPGWVSAEAREPLTATHVRLHLQARGGVVGALRWEARGCPYTLALCALLAERLPGQALADGTLDVRALAGELGAPTGKLGRFLVVQQALSAAALQLAQRPA